MKIQTASKTKSTTTKRIQVLSDSNDKICPKGKRKSGTKRKSISVPKIYPMKKIQSPDWHRLILQGNNNGKKGSK